MELSLLSLVNLDVHHFTHRIPCSMSFQSEDRSIWEAQDIYITMSPLMHVKKYSLQDRVGKLLLIHGEADENSGTFPMQSERYFAALKAFGKFLVVSLQLTILLCNIML